MALIVDEDAHSPHGTPKLTRQVFAAEAGYKVHRVEIAGDRQGRVGHKLDFAFAKLWC
uniref:hypothetical protein n=1 Tax=Polaromonas sp. W11N TaxID=1840303 RepID=UPI0015E7F441|nr:hypothetical protein [Polaromonas sp. W11N]